ncbi:MAG TPA: N-formylglutamate amidohydrolase [Polyangiaceae bacterium]|nr:N-formylglutamate amidohydrolase [Polyangiaceae bacterium]
MQDAAPPEPVPALSQLLAPLLTEQDPPPFRAREGHLDSPFLFAADHAGQLIPRSLGTLGLSAAELDTHIAWDIGIAGVTDRLAHELGAFMILQTYSRLVIDCNRPPGSPQSIVEHSEHTAIPGNRGLGREQMEQRLEAVFQPYHQRIQAELARRERAEQQTIFVAMHSFTPRYKGIDRPWHCGVLYNRDARLARPLIQLLAREGLEVGDNQPYFVSDDSDYAIPHYGERRGHLHVELELRQDLITYPDQQARWASLLARVLPAAVAAHAAR